MDKQSKAKTEPKSPGRKTYSPPVLRHYGDVHLLTRGTGATANGDAGQTMNVVMTMSDPAVKQNRVRIGEHSPGIGLYLFDYKPAFRDACGHGRQFGVMADEVEAVMPAAVSVGRNGHKQVDYAMLGITRPAR